MNRSSDMQHEHMKPVWGQVGIDAVAGSITAVANDLVIASAHSIWSLHWHGLELVHVARLIRSADDGNKLAEQHLRTTIDCLAPWPRRSSRDLFHTWSPCLYSEIVN